MHKTERLSLVMVFPETQATPIPRSHTHKHTHTHTQPYLFHSDFPRYIPLMIEQEPQSADICDYILERIRIVLSVQEMRVGLGFIAPGLR